MSSNAVLSDCRADVTQRPYADAGWPWKREGVRTTALLIPPYVAAQLTPVPTHLQQGLWLAETNSTTLERVLSTSQNGPGDSRSEAPLVHPGFVMLPWEHPARPLLALANLEPDLRVSRQDANLRLQRLWSWEAPQQDRRMVLHPGLGAGDQSVDLSLSAVLAREALSRVRAWRDGHWCDYHPGVPSSSTLAHPLPADLQNLTDWTWVFNQFRPRLKGGLSFTSKVVLHAPGVLLGMGRASTQLSVLTGAYAGRDIGEADLALLGAPVTDWQPSARKTVIDTPPRVSSALGFEIPAHWHALRHDRTWSAYTVWPPDSEWALHYGCLPGQGTRSLTRLRPPHVTPKETP